MHRPPHPSNYTRPLRQIEEAGEMWDRIHATLAETWPRIVDSIGGQPGAQDYDGDGSGAASVLDEQGVPMPALSDPTGEACTRRDQPTKDLAELRRLCRQHIANAERVTAILASYQPRPADGYQRAHTAGDDPGCRSCARLEVGGAPRWEPVHRGVELDGEVVKLCSWCERWARHTGSMPPRRQLCDHHDGKRVRLPAGG